jgi:hypothetical protein
MNSVLKSKLLITVVCFSQLHGCAVICCSLLFTETDAVLNSTKLFIRSIQIYVADVAVQPNAALII